VLPGLWLFAPNRDSQGGSAWLLETPELDLLIDCPALSQANLAFLASRGRRADAAGSGRIVLTGREGHGRCRRLQEQLGWPVVVQSVDLLGPEWSTFVAFAHAGLLAWLIRAATPADVPLIVPLVHAAYRGEASRAGWTTEADLLDGPRTDADDVARGGDGSNAFNLHNLAEGNAKCFKPRVERGERHGALRGLLECSVQRGLVGDLRVSANQLGKCGLDDLLQHRGEQSTKLTALQFAGRIRIRCHWLSPVVCPGPKRGTPPAVRCPAIP
jgi:hypothetical protein